MTTPALCGVHHTARPTWKLAETLRFYRDTMGLKLVHAISARGWGPADHPDFLHFFFDSGKGSTIAFFYYIGDDRPDWAQAQPRYDFDATHTAWVVDTPEEVTAWRQLLESRGVQVTPEMRHEVIESIYFRDPNGYLLEVTRMLRPFGELDAADADRTLQAAIALEAQAEAGGAPFRGIDGVWQGKARAAGAGGSAPASSNPAVLVIDVEEFHPVVEAARAMPGATVTGPHAGYWRIDSSSELVFQRKPMGFKPALWWSMLTGGYAGRIHTYTRDELRIGREGT